MTRCGPASMGIPVGSAYCANAIFEESSDGCEAIAGLVVDGVEPLRSGLVDHWSLDVAKFSAPNLAGTRLPGARTPWQAVHKPMVTDIRIHAVVLRRPSIRARPVYRCMFGLIGRGFIGTIELIRFVETNRQCYVNCVESILLVSCRVSAARLRRRADRLEQPLDTRLSANRGFRSRSRDSEFP